MIEHNVAKILKQLALIFEENGFVIYYDNRFPSMRPRINETCDYLYHNCLGYMCEPLLEFKCRDKESQITHSISYNKNFPHSLRYDKCTYPSSFNIYKSLSIHPYQKYSEDETKELAKKLYNNLMKKPVETYIQRDLSFAKHYEAVTLSERKSIQ